MSIVSEQVNCGIYSIFLFSAFGFGIVHLIKIKFTNFSLHRQLLLFFGYSVGGIALIIAIVFLVKTPSILKSEKEFKEIINNKTYLTVEGHVENFNPPDSISHFESFSVKGVEFSYSDFLIINGFHRTSANGGPIKKDGQLVRIGYINSGGDNLIVKLEIAR